VEHTIYGVEASVRLAIRHIVANRKNGNATNVDTLTTGVITNVEDVEVLMIKLYKIFNIQALYIQALYGLFFIPPNRF